MAREAKWWEGGRGGSVPLRGRDWEGLGGIGRDSREKRD